MVTSEGQVHRFTFESYGFRVSLVSKHEDLLAKAVGVAQKALLSRVSIIENSASDTGYVFGFDFRDGVFYLHQNGLQTNHVSSEHVFFKYFNSILRLTVAENAVDTVFIHAGVIGRNGKAVVFPGRSFSGKTTLVAELIKLGAEYYSDEYAVIGSDGMVHPFPRELSLRSYLVENDEVDIAPEALGANIGDRPAEVGSVVITEFDDRSSWQPEVLTVGKGILETIPHTIPINADTKMSLKILNLAFANAIIVKSYRGDIKQDAVAILTFLDKHLN